jgi:PAS domain S-box-containing protein
MTEVQEAYTAILKSLKSSPRGLTITDLSRKIKKDRNFTAKYLEVLHAEGKVEARQVGSAKVYWLSQRVPMSAFLCFTKNMIIILDLNMNIVQVNDQYLTFSELSKEDLVGRNILENGLPIISTPEALSIITSVTKEQVIHDVRFSKNNFDFFYKMEVIPTLFEEKEKGLTIVLEDITEKKRHLKNMEFLARTAEELVDLPPESDIYVYIADQLKSLVPENPRYYIHSYDETEGQFIFRAIEDEKTREGVTQLFGFNPVGMKFPVKDFFYSAPFHENAFTFKEMRVMHFKPFYEEEEYSFYDACAHIFPKEACEQASLTFNIAKIYLTGLVWQEQLFGLVGICLGKDEKLENKQAILSFFRQASIALARRMTEQRLSRSEQKFKEFASALDIPVMILDKQNTILYLNRKFSDEFGYDLSAISSWNTWAEKAFPDKNAQKILEEMVKKNEKDTSEFQKEIFELTCGDNTKKPVSMKLISFSDGMKGIIIQ